MADGDPINPTTRRPGDQLAIAPIAKEHAADRIVEQLGALILRGDLREGEALPSERVLGERFGVARGTVRQAIHKLADWGLLQTRQGGITRIGKIEDAHSLEVTELRYRLGPLDERERREWIERRMLQGVSIIALAELRLDTTKLDELEVHVARLEKAESPEQIWDVDAEIWIELSRMSKNRLFEREVRWFFRVASGSRSDAPQTLMTPAVRLSFYRELLRRLRTKDAPARFYLEMVQLLLGSSG